MHGLQTTKKALWSFPGLKGIIINLNITFIWTVSYVILNKLLPVKKTNKLENLYY